MAGWATLSRLKAGMVNETELNKRLVDAPLYLKGAQPGQQYTDRDKPVQAPGFQLTGGSALFHPGLGPTLGGVTIDRRGYWAVKAAFFARSVQGGPGWNNAGELWEMWARSSANYTAIGPKIKAAMYERRAGKAGRFVARAIGPKVFEVGDVAEPVFGVRPGWSYGSESYGAYIQADYLGPYMGPEPIDPTALSTVRAHWRCPRRAVPNTTIEDLAGSYPITLDTELAGLVDLCWPDLDFYVMDQDGHTGTANDLKTWLFSSAHWWLGWLKPAETMDRTFIEVKTVVGGASIYRIGSANLGKDIVLDYQQAGGSTLTKTWSNVTTPGRRLIGIQVTPGLSTTADVSLLIDGALVDTVTQAKPVTTHGADDVALYTYQSAPATHDGGIADLVLGTGTLTEAQCLTEYERGTPA